MGGQQLVQSCQERCQQEHTPAPGPCPCCLRISHTHLHTRAILRQQLRPHQLQVDRLAAAHQHLAQDTAMRGCLVHQHEEYMSG
jgi:hypothetical protein